MSSVHTAADISDTIGAWRGAIGALQAEGIL